MHEQVVELRGVSFAYSDGEPILNNENLFLSGPGLVTILGPNGSGKTTLFKVILGLLKPSSGSVVINGEDVTGNPVKAGKYASLVPQLSAIRRDLPLTARELVNFVLRTRGRCKGRECEAKTTEILEAVGAAGIADKKLSEMSGGQLQRVLLARALATGADILLLDEPLSGIDPSGREYILGEIEKISKRKLVVMTTHDPVLTLNKSKTIVVFNRGVRAVGSPGDVFKLDLLRKAYGSNVLLIEKCLHVIS